MFLLNFLETVEEIDREFTFKQMQTETLLYCQH